MKTALAQTETCSIYIQALDIYVEFKLHWTERTDRVTHSLAWKNIDKEMADVVLHRVLSGRLNMT